MTHDLTALADELDAVALQGIKLIGSNERLSEIASALRSLAAQDQKPVAYVPISKNPDDKGQPIWRETRPHSQNPWTGYECENLYLSPPPAAGWDAAIDACKKVAESRRWSEEVKQNSNGARTYGNEEAIDYIVAGINALRLTAPPDSGAGESEPVGDPRAPQWLPKAAQELYFKQDWCGTCHRGWGFKPSVMPDHGGADAGVNVSRDVLLTLISVLDCALGDTDPSIDPDYTDDEVKRDYPVFWVCQQLAALSKPAPVAANASAEATYRLARWLAAAQEDPAVCEEMKADINAWMDAGRPNVQPSGNASVEARLREALDEAGRGARNIRNELDRTRADRDAWKQQFESASAAASEYSEFWEKHSGSFDQFGNYIPYSQIDGDLRAAKAEIEKLKALSEDASRKRGE